MGRISIKKGLFSYNAEFKAVKVPHDSDLTTNTINNLSD